MAALKYVPLPRVVVVRTAQRLSGARRARRADHTHAPPAPVPSGCKFGVKPRGQDNGVRCYFESLTSDAWAGRNGRNPQCRDAASTAPSACGREVTYAREVPAKMGAVHGVHMKYVAMSIGCVQTARSIDSEARFLAWSALWYCAILHALIAACFLLRVGMPLMGKSAKTGQVPWWSYVLFWGFHLPTWLYTELHTRHSVHTGTPVATEVRHA